MKHTVKKKKKSCLLVYQNINSEIKGVLILEIKEEILRNFNQFKQICDCGRHCNFPSVKSEKRNDCGVHTHALIADLELLMNEASRESISVYNQLKCKVTIN